MKMFPAPEIKWRCLFGDEIFVGPNGKTLALLHVREEHRLSSNLAEGYVVPVVEPAEDRAS